MNKTSWSNKEIAKGNYESAKWSDTSFYFYSTTTKVGSKREERKARIKKGGMKITSLTEEEENKNEGSVRKESE